MEIGYFGLGSNGVVGFLVGFVFQECGVAIGFVS